MIAVALVGLVLLGVAVWGWWAVPKLVAKELDDEVRQRREVDLRRGVFAFFVAAVVVLAAAIAEISR